MKKKDELQSRKEFFKEASEKALPILGMAILASTPLLSLCAKESPRNAMVCFSADGFWQRGSQSVSFQNLWD